MEGSRNFGSGRPQNKNGPDPKTAEFKSTYGETGSGSKHRVVATLSR